MEMHGKVGAVVLAAGRSQRMGRMKPLLPFGDKPMLARILEMIEAAGNIATIRMWERRALMSLQTIALKSRPVLEDEGVKRMLR